LNIDQISIGAIASITPLRRRCGNWGCRARAPRGTGGSAELCEPFAAAHAAVVPETLAAVEFAVPAAPVEAQSLGLVSPQSIQLFYATGRSPEDEATSSEIGFKKNAASRRVYLPAA
jgi:hypothetical protein